MRKKIVCVLLAALMCLGLLGAGVSASEDADYKILEKSVSVPEEAGDNEELFAGYVEELFYGKESENPPMSVGGESAGSRLSGDEKLAYEALVPVIKQIAAGERASAIISLGVTVNGNVPDVYVEFSGGFYDLDLDAVHAALLADCAYEMYWYDKTSGCQLAGYDGTPVPQMIFYFHVADAYMGADYYTTDTTKTGAAAAAAENAKSVVAQYASLGDYKKLVAYKEYICGEVTYNDDAASDDSTPYGDPWQLIYVFDGDESTNVVCEGYSKAFQYLCDMSEWNGDVSCYSVSGEMYSGGNGGGHMWNIVKIGGGNYLVDVTNSDEGSIGQDGELFLAGSAKEISGVFTFIYGDGTIKEITLYGYRFRAGYYSSAVDYYYDYDLIWGEDVLALEADDYDPAEGLVGIGLDRIKLKLMVGESCTLNASSTPTNLEVEYEWSSSNTEVAIVENGLVTAVAPGSATITVSAGGFSFSCAVTVDAPLACNENDNGSLTITIPKQILGNTEMLIVVGYESGRMSSYSIIPEPQWSNTLSLEGSQFKVFVLGDGYLPLCEAVSPAGN